MRTDNKTVMALLLGIALLPTGAPGADGDARKIKVRVEPEYPQLARQMHMTGTVKIEVIVAANGTVKSTRVLGGHPLLVQSAEQAIKRWRYEPGPESTTVVEFRFHAN